MKNLKKTTVAVAQINAALKRATAQARLRAKVYGTEALIAPVGGGVKAARDA